MAKRIFDIIFSLLALILLSPVFLVVAIWIKVDSKGSVFFRQTRVTRYGRNFRIFKFRTMRKDAEKLGLQITAGNDLRITKAGLLLRKYKLDELPQFINVLIGDMSVVGPRPEVPKYVAHYPEDVRSLILSVRPGITDKASIEFKDENNLLNISDDPEKIYIEKILPIKVQHYVEYVRTQNIFNDISIILNTVSSVIFDRKKK
ncbi:sugar transferase [Paralcaligenes ginsengisoli]